MILYNFICSNPQCAHAFEELVRPEEVIQCPQCQAIANRQLLNDPSARKAMDNPVRQAEIMMKGRNIRNKLLGKVPWRKSSSSQSE